MINIDSFIAKNITKRSESLFNQDMLDNKSVLQESIKNKSILVIGGAGSIGSSFIKTLLPFKPRSLTVVDISENALAELVRDLRSSFFEYIPEDFNAYPMAYGSEEFKRMFISRKGFNIAANFSAHKHVRSEKDVFSSQAMLKNNLLDAELLLETLCLYPPEEYFCVSTDKASGPVNLMGASKRLMEDLIFAYSDRFPVKTARFANVAFSNGSLLHSFLKRMEKRQPLAAPCDVKRFFVSPEEAGQICLLACVCAGNREILFPKLKKDQTMGFDEIALKLLNALGYRPLTYSSAELALRANLKLSWDSKDYPVCFTASDTTGEKPIEDFYGADEIVDMNRFNALGVIKDICKPDLNKIKKLLHNMRELFNNLNCTKDDIIQLIQNYLPDFKHKELGRSLDSKI